MFTIVHKVITGVMAAAYVVVVAMLAIIISVTAVDALKSTNFEFNETALGGLGITDSHSTNYQAAASGAMLGNGNSSSGTMQINNGHTTTNDPSLSFAVDYSNINFGSFSATAASVTTSAFEVLDYTSYGYIVQMFGTPPTNGAHTIAPMLSTSPSTAGTEQFGMNLVANTSPTSLGANPDHGQFGIGDPTTDYGTSDNYRFVDGDIIASGPKSSGLTRYTVSYIVNVSSLTPGGNYNGNQTFLCTATF